MTSVIKLVVLISNGMKRNPLPITILILFDKCHSNLSQIPLRSTQSSGDAAAGQAVGNASVARWARPAAASPDDSVDRSSAEGTIIRLGRSGMGRTKSPHGYRNLAARLGRHPVDQCAVPITR